MALIVVTGGPGAPGVTTTALGLALSWPRDVVLADCDREPAQAVPAGYLRGMDHGGRGLTALARVHREERSGAADLWQLTVPLTDSTKPARRFLPGFSQPAAVRLFDRVWAPLAESLATLETHGVDALVDAGRVGPAGLPLDLLARADAVCFVTRTHLRSLAATRLYLPLLSSQLAQLPVDRALGLVLVGPDRPYSASEVSTQFGVPCWAEVNWSPALAAVLSDGDPEPGRFHHSGFMGQFRKVALDLYQRVQSARHQEEAVVSHA